MPSAFPMAEHWEAERAVVAGAEKQAVVCGVRYVIFFPSSQWMSLAPGLDTAKGTTSPTLLTLCQFCLSLPGTGASTSLPWASDVVWLILPGSPEPDLLAHQKDCSLPTAGCSKFPHCVTTRVKARQEDVLTCGR